MILLHVYCYDSHINKSRICPFGIGGPCEGPFKLGISPKVLLLVTFAMLA